jgi:ABC-type Mn2+/Zn2+ transport system ATPase subunit
MTESMDPIIEFKSATLGYGQKVVLSGISFSIEPGEYLGLVGPNGAGKTTIVRAILGSIRPLSGDVNVRSASGDALCIGYVPQRDTIDYVLPYTVQQVVMMGRYRQIGLLRRPAEKDREIVQQSLAHAAVDGLADRSFRDLSGGQKQRVLIARALATQPEILILDEPTNGMDLPSRISVLELINKLHQGGNLTVIMISHLLDDVANHVRRIALVEPNFFQIGHVDEVLTAKNLSTLYQMSVDVHQMHGNKIILPGEHNGAQ